MSLLPFEKGIAPGKRVSKTELTVSHTLPTKKELDIAGTSGAARRSKGSLPYNHLGHEEVNPSTRR